MKEAYSGAISKADVEGRPDVFTRRSWPAVIRFARRFNRLCIPTSKEEEERYREKFGAPVEGITAEELSGLEDFSDLRELISRKLKPVSKKELGEVLAGAETSGDERPTKGAKALWKGEERKALESAVLESDFDGVDDGGVLLKRTALGLTVISERAQSTTMTNALRNAPEEMLGHFGMSESQRDIVCDLLSVMTKINAEYLRRLARVHSEEPMPDLEGDTLRERNFVSRRLEALCARITSAHSPIFDSKERDGEFSKYLSVLRDAYEPFERASGEVIRVEAVRNDLELAQKAFLEFHTKFPDFPLIAFPAFAHTVADDALDEEQTNWEAFGYDPEVRLYWQTPEQREKVGIYNELRDGYAAELQRIFPGIPPEDVEKYRIIGGSLISASGINLEEVTLSQEEDNIVLMPDEKPDDIDRKNLEHFLAFAETEHDRRIVSDPRFFELLKRTLGVHEFGHGVYPERSPAADALGAIDDDLCEEKSETLMWRLGAPVLQKEANRLFAGDGMRALNLAFAYEAMRLYRKFEPDEEDKNYFLAGKSVLETLREANVFSKNKNGKWGFVSEMLDRDWGPLFQAKLEKVLAVYKTADERTPEAGSTARALAKKLYSMTEVPEFKELKRS